MVKKYPPKTTVVEQNLDSLDGVRRSTGRTTPYGARSHPDEYLSSRSLPNHQHTRKSTRDPTALGYPSQFEAQPDLNVWADVELKQAQ